MNADCGMGVDCAKGIWHGIVLIQKADIACSVFMMVQEGDRLVNDDDSF
jgi:hypothetical protein